MGEMLINQTRTLYYQIDKDKVQEGTGMVFRTDKATGETLYVTGVQGILADIISENHNGKNDITQYNCSYKLWDPEDKVFRHFRCGRYSQYNQDFLLALDQLDEIGWTALTPFISKDDKGKGWWHGSLRHTYSIPNGYSIAGPENKHYIVKIDKTREGLPKVNKTTMKSKGEVREVADKTEIEDWIDAAIPRIKAKLSLWQEIQAQTKTESVSNTDDDGVSF